MAEKMFNVLKMGKILRGVWLVEKSEMLSIRINRLPISTSS